MTPYLTIFAAADETAMKGLSTAVRGDAAVRADTSAVYVLGTGSYSLAASWRRQIGLASLVAADAALRQPAIDLATLDIDAAGPFQGQMYDPDGSISGTRQARQFPRLAYGGPSGPTALAAGTLEAFSGGAVIWDLDADGNVIVPDVVKLAVLHQADVIIAGTRDGRIQAIRDGLASQSVGSLSESYDAQAVAGADAQRLCARAAELMGRFRLRQGRLL